MKLLMGQKSTFVENCGPPAKLLSVKPPVEGFMNKLSLKMKLAVGFGGLLLILVAMGFMAYRSVGRLADISNQVDEAMVKKDMASQIEAAIEKQSSGVRGFLLAGNEDLLKHDEEGRKQFADNMEKLGKLLTHEEGKKLHAEILHSYQEFRGTYDREIQMRRTGKTKEAVAVAFGSQMNSTR